jgi:hypothetical protein
MSKTFVRVADDLDIEEALQPLELGITRRPLSVRRTGGVDDT